MPRTLALLPDNDALLRQRLERLAGSLPTLVSSRIRAAMVIGSVAAGLARNASDIDVVLVLHEGLPRRSDYTWWELEVEPKLGMSNEPFPVQPIFIGRAGVTTEEPNLRAALDAGIPLWDPEGIFDDQSKARA